MDKVDVRFPQKPKAPVAGLPQTAEERAVALVDLMGRLGNHLDREADAARNRAASAVLAQLARDKQPLMLVYEEVSRRLRVDPEGMRALPPDLKDRLREATRTLSVSADANAQALRLCSASQKLLVDTVVASVNQARRAQAPAYGPGAAGYVSPQHPRSYGTAMRGPATAATLNTRL